MAWGECLLNGPERPRGLELLQKAEAAFAQLGAQRDLDMVKELAGKEGVG